MYREYYIDQLEMSAQDKECIIEFDPEEPYKLVECTRNYCPNCGPKKSRNQFNSSSSSSRGISASGNIFSKNSHHIFQPFSGRIEEEEEVLNIFGQHKQKIDKKMTKIKKLMDQEKKRLKEQINEEKSSSQLEDLFFKEVLGSFLAPSSESPKQQQQQQQQQKSMAQQQIEMLKRQQEQLQELKNLMEIKIQPKKQQEEEEEEDIDIQDDEDEDEEKCNIAEDSDENSGHIMNMNNIQSSGMAKQISQPQQQQFQQQQESQVKNIFQEIEEKQMVNPFFIHSQQVEIKNPFSKKKQEEKEEVEEEQNVELKQEQNQNQNEQQSEEEYQDQQYIEPPLHQPVFINSESEESVPELQQQQQQQQEEVIQNSHNNPWGQGAVGGCKIRIQNLNPDMEEGVLKDLLGCFGEMQTCNFEKQPQKIDAFIHFKDSLAAQEAIFNLDQQYFEGRLISVQIVNN